MKQLLQTTKVYQSDALQQFFLSLESGYDIQSAEEKYSRLVNFSANAQAPFHQWFPYREGFSGQLIEELLAMSGVRPGECVIDPFCGSGTTNVVAALSGCHTLGLDVNPMSAFLAQVKTDHYSPSDLAQTADYLERLADFPPSPPKPAYESIRHYFPEEHFLQLARIRAFLDSLPPSKSKNILLIAFDAILLDCSHRKRDGNGLKTRSSKVPDAAAFYAQKTGQILRDIQSLPLAPGTKGYGVHASACRLAQVYRQHFGRVSAGAILFSPPYANSFDYFESYKLELVFGDYAGSLGGIHALRSMAVRSFVGVPAPENCDPMLELLAGEIQAAIPQKERETGKRDGRTRKVPAMLRGYFSDMEQVLRQCAQTLERGKRVYIVVDQSAYCGKIVPTDLLLAYYGEQQGFRVGRIIQCRRARTSTQQLQKYPYLKTTLRESIVELIRQ